MRGLIYKEFSVFCKCIDKKRMAFITVIMVILIYNVGLYGGLMASLMLAMAIGIQNIMSFVSDDSAHWKKYQMALPVSDFSVVASKYISVIYTLGISLLGSIALNILTSVVFHNFDFAVWGISAFAAVIIPLIWTGISLPFIYWFGLQAAQTMSMFIIVPIFCIVKYFEDKAGFSAMTDSLSPYLLLAGAVTVIIYVISMLVSVIGYTHKR